MYDIPYIEQIYEHAVTADNVSTFRSVNVFLYDRTSPLSFLALFPKLFYTYKTAIEEQTCTVEKNEIQSIFKLNNFTISENAHSMIWEMYSFIKEGPIYNFFKSFINARKELFYGSYGNEEFFIPRAYNAKQYGNNKLVCKFLELYDYCNSPCVPGGLEKKPFSAITELWQFLQLIKNNISPYTIFLESLSESSTAGSLVKNASDDLKLKGFDLHKINEEFFIVINSHDATIFPWIFESKNLKGLWQTWKNVHIPNQILSSDIKSATIEYLYAHWKAGIKNIIITTKQEKKYCIPYQNKPIELSRLNPLYYMHLLCSSTWHTIQNI